MPKKHVNRSTSKPTDKKQGTTTLVWNYGLYWRKDVVTWTKRGQSEGQKLLGRRGEDFWEARGVYALYNNFHIVYIGQAFDRVLGKRLSEHLTDDKRGRWDSFSWFAVTKLKKGGEHSELSRVKTISTKELVDSLEAVGIYFADPPLNRQRMKIPRAMRVEQRIENKPAADEKLDTISDKLDRLLSSKTNQ